MTDENNPGAKALNNAEMKASFQLMLQLLPDIIKQQTIWSQIRFAKYTSLQKSGFTKEEALQIVIEDGPSLSE